MGFKRDIFTGKLVETQPPEGGREIIARGSLPFGEQTVTSRIPNPDYDRECVALSIKPEEATPERIAEHNEQARRHNTGAFYDRDGRCMTSTRGSQNREMRRRNYINNDAGFGDFAGR
jgi:hypothetical protein